VATQEIPAAEFDVSTDLVARLLGDQHPDLADQPLRVVENGWDNVIVRIGDDLVARLPRRQVAAELVVHEQRWLPELAPVLPLPVPVPVRVGVPGAEYPWRWSICRWFAGDVAADVGVADPTAEAIRLGGFVRALHRPGPADAPRNPYRGQPVGELAERVAANVARLGSLVDGPAVMRAFERAAGVGESTGPPVWVHGDLHSANLLVADGRIAVVIDFGDLTTGDPAVDLAVGWMLFDRAGRDVFRAAAGPVDDGTWSRGEAWAVHFALLYRLHSANNPRFGRMADTLLARLLG
jgi:aminoglycoside phosphotransferase (APT) family kinase protein